MWVWPAGNLPAPCTLYMRRYVKYVGSFLLLIPPSANACHIVSKWISISHFHLTRQQCVCLPPPFSLHPLTPSATARGSRSMRDWERKRRRETPKKWVPTRLRYASAWCLPRHPSPRSLSPLLIYFASSFGHIRKRDKNFILMKTSRCCWGSVFIFYFIFSAFLMMLLKAIHKISHTATHNGNRSSRKRGGQGGGVTKYVWIRRKSWKRRIIQFGSVPFGTHSRIYFIIAPRRMLLKCRHKCVGWAPTHPHTHTTDSHKRTHTW